MRLSCSDAGLCVDPGASINLSTVRWCTSRARANSAVLVPSQCSRIYRTMNWRGNLVGASRRVPRTARQTLAATRGPSLLAIACKPSTGMSSVRKQSQGDGRLMPRIYIARPQSAILCRFFVARSRMRYTPKQTPSTPIPRRNTLPNMTTPIVPWIGGKRRLARSILPLFGEHDCYVEPFAGAAALFFLKEPTKSEVLNDVNGEIVNLYRVIKNHFEEFAKQFKYGLISREIFKWLQITPIETLTDIQRAARFYYLQKLCFGGKVNAQTFGTTTTSRPRLNLLRLEMDLSEAHLRLATATIEHLDWAECVRRYDRPHSLFYCDPPYWGTEGYGVPFGLDQYDRLAELARTIQGRMIISVNDIPEMRTAFKGLWIDRLDIKYTVGGGDKAVPRGELVIRNWK